MANDPGKKPALHKKHVARLQREQQQSRIILYAFIGILITVVLLLVYGYLDINYFQLKRPVAKVGETEILANQFEARVRLQRQQLLGQYNQYNQYAQAFGIDVSAQIQEIQTELDTPTKVGQVVLDQLINEELIRQEAKKRGITVTEEELNDAMQGAFGFYPNGSPTPSVTPTEVTTPEFPAEALAIVSLTPTASATPEVTATTEFTATVAVLTTGTPGVDITVEPSATPTATLEATIEPTAGPTFTPQPTATAYTLEGFEGQFKDARDRMTKLGMTESDYRGLFEMQILERKLKDVIAGDTPHTEKQVWARHILVSDATLAATIIERLKNGEDFATLAKELSVDTGSAVNGGDLGWFGTGAMVAEFETAAFALEKPGDITPVAVQSQFGYHIIQLIAKQDRPLSQADYDKARDKVFQDWLNTTRTEYGVETYDFWKERTPSEPSFISIATDAANAQSTARAETAQAPEEATATP